MRLHISLDEQLVKEIDRKVGRRQRSGFIEATLERVLDDERRWRNILTALNTIPAKGHDWDEDPAAWTRAQRRGDTRRVG